jgi:hypothetical protein
MHPMPQANAMNLKSRKSLLLGTSALVCLALVAPVMAADVQKLNIKMYCKTCLILTSKIEFFLSPKVRNRHVTRRLNEP